MKLLKDKEDFMISELSSIKEYITTESAESSKDHLIFPLFKKVFGSKNFNKESEASGADIYINGRLIVELKTKYDDWVTGFFQACHYMKEDFLLQLFV